MTRYVQAGIVIQSLKRKSTEICDRDWLLEKFTKAIWSIKRWKNSCFHQLTQLTYVRASPCSMWLTINRCENKQTMPHSATVNKQKRPLVNPVFEFIHLANKYMDVG